MLLTIRIVGAIALLVIAGHGVGALVFRGPRHALRRRALIAGWLVLAAIGLAGLITRHGAAVWLWVAGAAGWAAWWIAIRPRHDRDWAPDVARMLESTRDGAHVRLTNVRNFAWRTREDFTPRWETRDYDAGTIVGVDLAVSYWGGPNIAHTLVAFAFADGRHLCFSVEVRRTSGGHFSAVGGLFRQCELVIVAADERDILRTRSNVRGEDVHLYRVGLPLDDARALFFSYLDSAARLEHRPRFYNTLTANCTTLIYDMVKPIVPGLPWNWRLIVSGRLPDYLYRLGALDRRLDMATLRRRGRINERAIACDIGPGHTAHDFSNHIRNGLPAPVGWPAPPP